MENHWNSRIGLLSEFKLSFSFIFLVVSILQSFICHDQSYHRQKQIFNPVFVATNIVIRYEFLFCEITRSKFYFLHSSHFCFPSSFFFPSSFLFFLTVFLLHFGENFATFGVVWLTSQTRKLWLIDWLIDVATNRIVRYLWRCPNANKNLYIYIKDTKKNIEKHQKNQLIKKSTKKNQ